MADHSNINHPDMDERWSNGDLASAKLAVEVAHWKVRYQGVAQDLDAIFTRIANGQTVELHYQNGTMIVIQAVKDGEAPNDGR